MKFIGPVTLPSGGAANFHRVVNVVLDAENDRAILDLASWPTREAGETGYAPEQRRVSIAFAELPAAAGFLAAIKASITGTGAPLDGTVEDTPALTLADAKIRKRKELAAAWTAELASGVTVGSKVAPSDAAAWTRYLALKAMAEDADWVDVPIPLLDGTFELMTKAKAGALWTALKTLERTLLAKLGAKVGLLAAATTVAEVDAITWAD